MGKMIELTAADGFLLPAYRADPAGTPRGGLVVAQEIFGVNSHIRSVCDGFAADGYRVIAPALFERYEKGVDIGYAPPDIVRGRDLKARAETETALQDVAAARDALAPSGGQNGASTRITPDNIAKSTPLQPATRRLVTSFMRAKVQRLSGTL